jgi:hypothetical protein
MPRHMMNLYPEAVLTAAVLVEEYASKSITIIASPLFSTVVIKVFKAVL